MVMMKIVIMNCFHYFCEAALWFDWPAFDLYSICALKLTGDPSIGCQHRLCLWLATNQLFVGVLS